MKKITYKMVERDKKRDIRLRQDYKGVMRPPRVMASNRPNETWHWINRKKKEDIDLRIDNRNRVTLVLPETMNFSSEYEKTALNMQALRRLVSSRSPGRNNYKLYSVDFGALRNISTSAALVLTSELSRWEDTLPMDLKAATASWDPEIKRKFHDLGFFSLFPRSLPEGEEPAARSGSDLQIVKYIKNRCSGTSDARRLRSELRDVIGKDVDKWTFLRFGLDEAIGNVTEHAYPTSEGYRARDKNWYLTGAYNSSTKELKIVFFDQGIGIPASLPASALWEKVLNWLSSSHVAKGPLDEQLLRAAMEVARTRTSDEDRGKGLPDMLEFIKQRQDGYLSVISGRGLYKFSIVNGHEKVRSHRFNNRTYGTLIIWMTKLQ